MSDKQSTPKQQKSTQETQPIEIVVLDGGLAVVALEPEDAIGVMAELLKR